VCKNTGVRQYTCNPNQSTICWNKKAFRNGNSVCFDGCYIFSTLKQRSVYDKQPKTSGRRPPPMPRANDSLELALIVNISVLEMMIGINLNNSIFDCVKCDELLSIYHDDDNDENDDYSDDDANDWRRVWRFSQIIRRFLGLLSTFRLFPTCQHYITAQSNTHTHTDTRVDFSQAAHLRPFTPTTRSDSTRRSSRVESGGVNWIGDSLRESGIIKAIWSRISVVVELVSQCQRKLSQKK